MSELSIDEIAAMAVTKTSFKGIPGDRNAVGKAGLATKDGHLGEKAKAAALAEAANEGRVIVQPKAAVDSVMRMINEKFDETFIHDKFKDVLEAKKTIVLKGGGTVEVADHQTQVRALELLLKYRIGLPVQRTEVVTPKNDSAATLRAKLASSAALRRAFRDTLDRLDAVDVTDADEDGVRKPMRRVRPGDEKYAGVQG